MLITVSGDTNKPLLLINSHFDSGVGATGASDDGVATVMNSIFSCIPR